MEELRLIVVASLHVKGSPKLAWLVFTIFDIKFHQALTPPPKYSVVQ